MPDLFVELRITMNEYILFKPKVARISDGVVRSGRLPAGTEPRTPHEPSAGTERRAERQHGDTLSKDKTHG